MAARNQLLGIAAKDPRLVRVRPNGLEDVAQYRIDVDWDKAGALGVPIDSIHTAISASFGGRVRLLSPLQCTGLKPQFLDKLAANGVALHSSFFVNADEAGPGMHEVPPSPRFGGYS